MKTKKSNFTLIELLAAMGVFSIIMLVVFQMLASSQKVWSMTETNTRIYENARIALDVITRDLQCAIASDRDGGEIPFWTGSVAAPSTTPTGNDLLAFISAVDPTSSAQSKLCEVVYHHADNTSGAYEFKRSIVCDTLSSGVANSDWDFYAVSSGTAWLSGASRNTVIRGVDDLYFVCQEADTTEMTAGTYTTLPATVYVSITLFDPKLSDVWDDLPDAKKNQSRRTFTKMIYLKTDSL